MNKNNEATYKKYKKIPPPFSFLSSFPFFSISTPNYSIFASERKETRKRVTRPIGNGVIVNPTYNRVLDVYIHIPGGLPAARKERKIGKGLLDRRQVLPSIPRKENRKRVTRPIGNGVIVNPTFNRFLDVYIHILGGLPAARKEKKL